MLGRRVILLLALLASSGLVVARPVYHNRTFNWDEIDHVIAFGDSYSYVQGTHGRQNYSFIGDYFNLGFSPKELLGDRIVQNQTSTAEGGPNYLEYLTSCGLSPGLTSPFSCTAYNTPSRHRQRHLWDFAFAGADISLAPYTPQHHNFTVPLVNQTQQFASYAQPVLFPSIIPRPSNALVVFWIGINDIGDSADYVNSSSPAEYTAFYNDLMDIMFTQAVETVYEAGSYSNHLFVNLPPLDRTPGNVNRTEPSPSKSMVDAWNAALAAHALVFETEHPGTKAMVYDANSFLNGVLDEPERWGIKDTQGYCEAYDQVGVDVDPGMYGCLPLGEYFWFNTGHLTSHVHEILAGEMRAFLGGDG